MDAETVPDLCRAHMEPIGTTIEGSRSFIIDDACVDS